MEEKQWALIIVDHFYPYLGGWETLFWNIAKKYHNEWKQVFVLTSKYSKDLKWEEFIDWLSVKRVWSTRFAFMLYSFFSALSIIRSNNISLVHTSSCFAMRPSSLLSKMYGIYGVITIHEIYGLLRVKLFGRWKWFWKLLGEKLSLAICSFDEYQCVSAYTLNSLRLMTLLPDNTLKIVRNVIDVSFRSSEKVNKGNIDALKKAHNLDDKKVGLFFGRLGYIKWLDTILLALPDIIKQNPDFRLIIVSPYNKKLSNLVTSKLSNFIIWMEQVPQEELRDRIWLSHVCILPSKAEWFGYAIAEAASMWANIITTSIGAIPEVLGSYQNVRFVWVDDAKGVAKSITF